MTPNAPPDEAIARFAGDVQRLLGPHISGRIGLAISGGPDSLALLLLAAAAFPDSVEAATVDHKLRPEAEAEARFVADVCTALGVPHAILTLDPSRRGKANVSDWARQARYAALSGWMKDRALDHMFTAHHADDQLETMLMRLNRGAGVAGLSGVRSRLGTVARPLLGWRKTELEALARTCGLEPVLDPGNSDDRFDRARLRKALASADWLDPLAATRSAAALEQAEEALAWSVHRLAAERLSQAGPNATLDAAGLPRELARRLVLKALRLINTDCTPRGADMERLIDTLGAGRTATLAGVKCHGGALWTFAPAPPHRAGR